MNDVDRYLKRATRGLWGQKKRDIQAELRGAVEDKVYRCRLLGLDEAQAVASALRDLGSPAAVARELREVHTVPQTFKVLAFVGVAGLLGFQAVAQVATVKSVYLLPPSLQAECRLPTAQELAAIPVAQRERVERVLKAQGKPEQYLEYCRKVPYKGPVLLNVEDLFAALRAGGVEPLGQEYAALMTALRAAGVDIRGQEQAATTPLFSFTGNRTVLPGAAFLTDNIQGERYLSSSMVIPFLKQVIALPLHLNGLTNPVLSVGQVNLQLGTPAAPVKTTDLLTFALLDERRTNSALPLPVTLAAFLKSGPLNPRSAQLALRGQDGELYAVVQNTIRLNGDEFDALSVHSLRRGKLDLTLSSPAAPLMVNSMEDMDAATAQGREAVLVYKLDATDLRDMKLTPVPASQIKVQSPQTSGR